MRVALKQGAEVSLTTGRPDYSVRSRFGSVSKAIVVSVGQVLGLAGETAESVHRPLLLTVPDTEGT